MENKKDRQAKWEFLIYPLFTQTERQAKTIIMLLSAVRVESAVLMDLMFIRTLCIHRGTREIQDSARGTLIIRECRKWGNLVPSNF